MFFDLVCVPKLNHSRGYIVSFLFVERGKNTQCCNRNCGLNFENRPRMRISRFEIKEPLAKLKPWAYLQKIFEKSAFIFVVSLLSDTEICHRNGNSSVYRNYAANRFQSNRVNSKIG